VPWYDSCGKQSYRKKSVKPDIDQLPLESMVSKINDDHIPDESLTKINYSFSAKNCSFQVETKVNS
jgi:hypothetical protein